MLCCEKNFEIICCNEQLLELKNNRINQVGLIIGGLESHRKEIYELGKKICTHFPNLFGYIGVDILRVKNHWQIIEINPRMSGSSVVSVEAGYPLFDDMISILRKKKCKCACSCTSCLLVHGIDRFKDCAADNELSYEWYG